MNSPFYEAEQKAMYPHRIRVTDGVNQIANHIQYLIENNYDTLEKISKTPLGELQHKYFINGSTFEIFDAIQKYKNTKA